MCQAQEELLVRSKIWPAATYVLSEHTWVMMSIEHYVEIQGRQVTSSRPRKGKIDEKTRRMHLKAPQIYYKISGLNGLAGILL